jgi:hypothetical protein
LVNPGSLNFNHDMTLLADSCRVVELVEQMVQHNVCPTIRMIENERRRRRIIHEALQCTIHIQHLTREKKQSEKERKEKKKKKKKNKRKEKIRKEKKEKERKKRKEKKLNSSKPSKQENKRDIPNSLY